MSDPKHEAIVGCALLGIVTAKGWVKSPVDIDLLKCYAELRERGGVNIGRDTAVAWGVGLMERAGGFPASERATIERLLGRAYSDLVETVGI